MQLIVCRKPYGIILVVLLLSSLILAFRTQTAKASGPIYIRADGSVDPSSAPILRDGCLYFFYENVTTDTDGLIIEASNIALDGAEYTIKGMRSGNGIALSQKTNVTIKNLRISGFYVGIDLANSSGNCISQDTIVDCAHGLYLSDSTSNTLLDDTLTECDYGITMILSSRNILSNNTFADCGTGVFLWESSYCEFSGNLLTENGRGIVFTDSSAEKVFNNNFVNNQVHVDVNLWCSPHIYWDGSYWSDYTEKYPRAIEIDESGVWNTPYSISEGNSDQNPLVHPYGSSALLADVSHDLHVDMIDVVKITSSFGATLLGLSWNSDADLGEPYGIIDSFDVFLCTSYYGSF